MEQILAFTAVAIGLYVFTDWALDWLERRRGERFENRSVIFFITILVLALVSFELINRLIH